MRVQEARWKLELKLNRDLGLSAVDLFDSNEEGTQLMNTSSG